MVVALLEKYLMSAIPLPLLLGGLIKEAEKALTRLWEIEDVEQRMGLFISLDNKYFFTKEFEDGDIRAMAILELFWMNKDEQEFIENSRLIKDI